MSVARALGRRVAVAAACALLAPTVAHAHTPGAVLRGFGTPNVDGLLGPGEWAGAATKDLEVSRPGGGAVPATVFVMNDGTSLYLGFRISQPVLDPAEGLYFAFDNDHDGLTETGDDLLFLGGSATGAGPRDMVIDFAAGLLPDVEVGGTSDIRGAVGTGSGFVFFELAHPLNTADDAHDFSLARGQTVGLSLDHHTCLCPQDLVAVWPGTARANTWADVVVATALPTLSVDEARLLSSWRASRYTGRLVVAGSTSEPAELEIELRSPVSSNSIHLPQPLYSFKLSAPGGRFRAEFDVSPELVPGSYGLRVAGTSAGYRYPDRTRSVLLRGPPEGVVARAYVSATQDGLEAFSLPADAREIWAHFEFAARPQRVCRVRKVKGKRRRVCAVPPITAVWYRPNGRAAGPAVPKPNTRTIVSFVRSNAPLEPGRWRCILRVGTTLVMQVEVQVG